MRNMVLSFCSRRERKLVAVGKGASDAFEKESAPAMPMTL
jgi:hypothetical protein